MAEETRKETVRLRNEAEKLRREIEQSKDKSMQKAKAEARRILENARREADGIIGELKAMKKQAQIPEHELQKLRKRMDDNLDAVSEGIGEANEHRLHAAQDGSSRARLWKLSHLKTKAAVLTLPDSKGEVQVQAGIMKMKVPAEAAARSLSRKSPRPARSCAPPPQPRLCPWRWTCGA